MEKFISGDSPLGSPAFYRLFIPDDGWLLNNVILALSQLADPERWSVQGDVPIETIISMVVDTIITFDPGAIMTGAIIPYAGKMAALPYGYLPCDGTTYESVDYPNLWAVIDDAWKISATQFVTPDLRGRTVIGTGQGAGLTLREMADQVGAEEHVLTVAEMPAHAHAYDPVIVGDLDTEAGGIPQPNAAQIVPLATENTYDTGDGDGHNNMQPSLALNYVVVAL